MPPTTATRRPGYNVILTLFVGVVLTTCCFLYLYPAGKATARPLYHLPLHVTCNPNNAHPPKRVAIIGAGAAGASTAYHIIRFGSPCQLKNITVYERSDYIGGRTTTVDVYGDPDEPVELGGSIFVEVNKILVTAAKEFGLETGGSDGRPRKSPQTLGVWDGETFKFVQEEGGYMWWSIAKLIWKYGLAPIRTQNLMQSVVGNFLKMYEEPYFPFRSLSERSLDLGLTAVTSATGKAYLAANSITPPFSTDIIQASTRVNYAQNLGDIHGLGAMVCMSTNGAMAVKGGNWQIFDGMLRAVGANVVLNTSVSEISKQANGTYLVRSTAEAGSRSLNGPLTEEFDSVILATPLQFSKIKLSPALSRTPDEIPYVNLHVTLFASPHKLSPFAFNLPYDALVPEVVLTTLPSEADFSGEDRAPAGFFSISTLRHVRNTAYSTPRLEYLYKIFSPQPVNATFLSSLLGFPAPGSGDESLRAIEKEDLSWVYEKSWNSYPYLLPRVTFDDPQLDDNLWYTSGIESFISTMETSALMGMNVAKLIVSDWEKEGKEEHGSPSEL